MYYDEHNPPHFHARYGKDRAAIEIESLRVCEGKLPPRALGLVVEWAADHRDDWPAPHRKVSAGWRSGRGNANGKEEKTAMDGPEAIRTTRAALVTGGGQGIGKAVVQRLLRDGWAVCLAEIDAEAGEETAHEYSSLGPVIFAPTDVADEGQVHVAVAAAVAAFGRLDGLVNNAGIATAHGPRLEELAFERWNRVLAVNLSGPMLCAKHAAPHLRAAGGAIVNIASTRALMSEGNTEAYTASKGGVLALTHALAVSLGPAVRVNCVSPGWIDVGPWKKQAARYDPQLSAADHAQHPAGRVGKPEDVAALVAYLLADQAGFITGANFVVDGGMSRKMHYL